MCISDTADQHDLQGLAGIIRNEIVAVMQLGG